MAPANCYRGAGLRDWGGVTSIVLKYLSHLSQSQRILSHFVFIFLLYPHMLCQPLFRIVSLVALITLKLSKLVPFLEALAFSPLATTANFSAAEFSLSEAESSSLVASSASYAKV